MTIEIDEFWFMKKILWHVNFTRIFWQNFVIFTHDKSDNDFDQNKICQIEDSDFQFLKCFDKCSRLAIKVRKWVNQDQIGPDWQIITVCVEIQAKFPMRLNPNRR